MCTTYSDITNIEQENGFNSLTYIIFRIKKKIYIYIYISLYLTKNEKFDYRMKIAKNNFFIHFLKKKNRNEILKTLWKIIENTLNPKLHIEVFSLEHPSIKMLCFFLQDSMTKWNSFNSLFFSLVLWLTIYLHSSLWFFHWNTFYTLFPFFNGCFYWCSDFFFFNFLLIRCIRSFCVCGVNGMHLSIFCL